MRTTVEIRDDQREALVALAARRGIRGFSDLVQEAIDRYLEDGSEASSASFLALQGSISDEEAAEMRRVIREMKWRVP